MPGKTWCLNEDVERLPEYGASAFALLLTLCRIAKGTDGTLDPQKTRIDDLEIATGFSRKTIIDALLKLEKVGRISIQKRTPKPTVYTLLTVEKIHLQECNNSTFNSGENPPLKWKNSTDTVEKLHLHLPYKDKDLDKDRDRVVNLPPEKPFEKQEQVNTLKGTARPTQERVSDYFKSCGYMAAEAFAFFDAMQSRGWTTFGKNPTPVQDWMAQARMWNRRQIEFQQEKLPERNGNGYTGPDPKKYIVPPARPPGPDKYGKPPPLNKVFEKDNAP